MPPRTSLTPDETRGRILRVAAEHFFRMGYSKTAVSDIAESLGMSPANIYRFFPSKSAINDAICAQMLQDTHDLIDAIVARPLPVAERLRELVLEIHRFNRNRFTDHHRIHDMVEVAMKESWPAVKAHIEQVRETFIAMVRSGVSTGELTSNDPARDGTALHAAVSSFFHPTMIAQCADEPMEEKIDATMDLLLRGLGAEGRAKSRNSQPSDAYVGAV